MKNLLASSMLAFLLLVAPQVNAASTCLPGNDAQAFIDYASTLPVQIHELNARGRGAYLTHVNKIRADAKMFPLEADRIIFGVFNGIPKVGVAMFFDGCVVPGTVATVAIDDFQIFLDAAAVRPEDIIKQVSSAI